MQLYLQILFRLLIAFPLGGALVGCIAAHVGFNGPGAGLSSGSDHYYDLGFTSSYGIPFGGLIGLVFGLVVVWPLRRVRLHRVLTYLGGGTLALALPSALLGPTEAFLIGPWGFWLGFGLLLENESKKGSNSSSQEVR